MVSVVVITYNRCNLLKETLQSILSQTFEKLEIILIDDGSNDETSECAVSLSDKRLKYFNFGRIGNLSKLRNIGIKHSSYDIIGFCDDDDLWHPGKLEKQLKYFNEYDLICSNAKVININGDFVREKYFPEINESFEIGLSSLLANGNPILTSSTLLKKKIMSDDKIFFDEVTFTNHCEDFELFIRLTGNNRFYFIGESLISKRVHESVSGGLDNNLIMLNASVKILKEYKKGKSPEIKKKSLEGIIGYNIPLIKLSFKKDFFLGLNECIRFIALLFSQKALMIFINLKIITKIKKLF